MEIESYLQALASDEPTPGGGSAAAIVGGLGASLIAMVARVTMRSPKLADVAAQAESVAGEADTMRLAFLTAAARDEAAYRAVIDAQALPKADDAAATLRTSRLQRALIEAAEAPLDVAVLARDGMALAERAAQLGNQHVASDVACARHFLRAAAEAARENVIINHALITDAVAVGDQRQRLDAMLAAVRG